ncbi:leucyl aminopeptidase family protein [Kineococcus sp. SYSU DK001]|uniref:leucyl aminopeptidase family protein n=1 Tax=Kineococcus sp. SYSU DK001 TaxID=3383122 RepID=UPI003D7DDFDD
MSTSTAGSPVTSAAPDLRRWTPPAVEVRRGDLVGADLSGLDVLAVPVAAGEGADAPLQPRPGAADAAVRYGIDLAAVCAAEQVTGTGAAVTRLPVPAPEGSPRKLLVVAVGDSSPAALRRSGAALARAASTGDVATTLADGVGPAGTRALVEGFLLASYSPPVSGRRAASEPPARRLVLFGAVDPADVRHAEVSAGATVLARDLAATPSNLKDPRWVTEQVRQVARELRLEVDVRDEARLRAEGFGGLLAVGAGSASPPALVQVGWTPPAAPGAPHVVLVGKGITYDTGGLGIKPRESMVAMKTDMAGSAAVLAVVAAAARLELPVRVTGLLALAENSFGGSSYRPGDVVTHYGGRTTEVNNTDAEGRLVLGDALAYADAVLRPDVLVDVATLTGAATLGLGKRHAALYATGASLVDELVAAAAVTGERVWHMPLVEDYAAAIESDVADARQVTTTPGHGAGSIVAALFLRPFTGGRRWAHLDIAGTGRADAPEHEVTRGATGFGARLLLEWLETSVARG